MPESKTLTLQEVKKHNKPENLWVIIHNNVYDLTKFKLEHPGGPQVLEEVAGQNATEAFDDVGHSQDAVEMMGQYYIGKLDPADRERIESKSSDSGINKHRASRCARIVIPVGVVLVALLAYKFFL
ncbi:unnamed protein product [Calicophoron daubneyi]|uniref:Cytochrome b5 heme-binding domain-containing protein n=1 Tax=Calicophoron daubneyi TaxID=300641 RepID=A0AAV2THU4_CALDB